VRAATLPVRQELYIAAAEVSGLSRPYIIVRHVLPRIAGPVIVQASLMSAVALLAQTGLAFIGLIDAAPAPSWGGMIANGASVLELQSWLIWPPGIAIAVTIVAFGLLGDAVRDASTASWAASTPRRRARRGASQWGRGGAGLRRRPRTTAASARSPAVALSERSPATGAPLLSVEGLSVAFRSNGATTRVVDDVSFEICAGEVVGLVGESGCGKTVTAMSILGLLPGTGTIERGRIIFDGRDLAAGGERELRRARGRDIGLISQEPMISLDPAFRVGDQLAEGIRRHRRSSRKAARAQAVQLLRRVQLPTPEAVARRYPHELSGGMAQRVLIARALVGDPKLLIADEPTTALDVTVQAEILDLLRELQQERSTAILFITHDWGVVADICDRAVVMYAGQVVERADVRAVFRMPLHPYTEALLAADPHHAASNAALPTIPGNVPQPDRWPSGCRFHPRCHRATAACDTRAIALRHVGPDRETRCVHHERLLKSA
jgi:peptide/nickel transport system permease protein